MPVFGQAPALFGVVSEMLSGGSLRKRSASTNQVFTVSSVNFSCRIPPLSELRFGWNFLTEVRDCSVDRFLTGMNPE